MIDRKELVEKMLDGDFKGRGQNYDWRTCGSSSEVWFKGMDSALSVAVDELLKPATDQEMGNVPHACYTKAFLASRRAQFERVKTPEERVTVIPTNISSYSNVLLDGNSVGPGSMRNDQAEIYRLGLIQQLKGSA